MILDKDQVKKIAYGGDYNPEQWSKDIWEEDHHLFKKAGIDIVTLNVFNWAMLQPSENEYDFTNLDATVERVTTQGMDICMGTSTAAHPAWMARKYPDILRTEFNGMKRKFGSRHNSCPNSPTFQKYSVRLAEQLAKRYKDQKNIVVWHVSNEYGETCYCENCEKAFRVWLKEKYKTLERLNHAWNTNFWGHTFYDWDDVVVPNLLSEHAEEKRSRFQGITLDYMRFNSDSMLNNFKAEYEVIKKYLPDAKITTNFMGMYKTLDYQKWAPHLDLISWDSYPNKNEEPAYTALNHEVMRGLKGGKPFMLMEQTPSVSNWLPNNSLKRPGVMRLLSYQAIAHGADTVMFFQMRRSPGSCEKFHGAVIDHAGRDDTRVFKEVSYLGEELKNLGDQTLGSVTKAKSAIIFDWNTWWALECSAGPSTRLNYIDEILNYYRAFYKLNIPVDIIGVEDDFSKYQLIAAPLFYMVKPDVDKKLEKFAKAGGNLIFTYMSGYVDENDYITFGGYPGKLKDLTKIWVEEIDALSENEENSFLYQGKKYPAKLLCDIIHPEGAQIVAEYQEDFYQQTPVITKNNYGKGQVYYVGTRSSKEFYIDFIEDICSSQKIPMAFYDEIETSSRIRTNLEVVRRDKDGIKFIFLLNHGVENESIELPYSVTELLSGVAYNQGEILSLASYGVAILKKE